MDKKRCEWAVSDIEKDYHDKEWGNIVHDDSKLFEMLVLESMQAGLSWSIILSKRDTLSKAYDNFNYSKISNYSEEKIDCLLSDKGVIRNKLKIKATITNAKAFIDIQKEYGSFDTYIWSFVDFKPLINNWNNIKEIPGSTDLSDKISKELKKKGFKFLGKTTIYSFMQATGMVNDHMNYCFKK